MLPPSQHSKHSSCKWRLVEISPKHARVLVVTVYWEDPHLKQTSPGQQDHLLHSEKKPLPSQEILVAIRFPSTVLLGADVFVAHTESQFSVANRKCFRTQKSLRSPTICGKEWLSVISKPPQQEYHSNTVKNQPSSKTTCKEAPSGKKNVRHTPNDITENYSNSSTLWKNPTGLPTSCAEGADLSGNWLQIQRPWEISSTPLDLVWKKIWRIDIKCFMWMICR